jgi:hypothetical protein
VRTMLCNAKSVSRTSSIFAFSFSGRPDAENAPYTTAFSATPISVPASISSSGRQARKALSVRVSRRATVFAGVFGRGQQRFEAHREFRYRRGERIAANQKRRHEFGARFFALLLLDDQCRQIIDEPVALKLRQGALGSGDRPPS